VLCSICSPTGRRAAGKNIRSSAAAGSAGRVRSRKGVPKSISWRMLPACKSDLASAERLWLTAHAPPFHGSTALHTLLMSGGRVAHLCFASRWQCEERWLCNGSTNLLSHEIGERAGPSKTCQPSRMRDELHTSDHSSQLRLMRKQIEIFAQALSARLTEPGREDTDGSGRDNHTRLRSDAPPLCATRPPSILCHRLGICGTRFCSPSGLRGSLPLLPRWSRSR